MGRAELFRELRHKTVRALRVGKEAYVRGICEGVEHHLWSSDSRPACRGIRALRSSKPIPRCAAIRAEHSGFLTESEVKAHCARCFERLYYPAVLKTDPPADELYVWSVRVTIPIADPLFNCGPPSIVETQTGVNWMKWTQAPWICGIHAELLKAGGNAALMSLHAVLCS